MNFAFLLPCHLLGTISLFLIQKCLPYVEVFSYVDNLFFSDAILTSCSSAEFFFCQSFPLFPASTHHNSLRSNSLLYCFHVFPDRLAFTHVCSLNARVYQFPVLNCVCTSASCIQSGVAVSVLYSVFWFPSQHFHLLRKI